MIIPPLAANAGFGGLGGDELGAGQEGAIQQSSGWLSRREWPHTGLAGRLLEYSGQPAADSVQSMVAPLARIGPLHRSISLTTNLARYSGPLRS